MATIPEALTIALQHHQAGRLPLAEQIYRQVLQADPNEADAVHLLGVIAHQVGKLDTATEYMRKAITLRSDVADFHDSLAKVHHASGRIPEAVACFRRALELTPGSAGAHNNLGIAIRDQGDLDEALACFHRASALDPTLADAHNNLGLTFKEQGRLEEAIASLRRALELRPSFAEAYNNLGLALGDVGEPNEAVACCRRALELTPDSADVYSNLGGALALQGKVDEAVSCFRRALDLRPSFAEAHSNLGLALKNHGRLEEAVASFRRAIEIKPSYAEAHHNLGLTLLQLGRYEEAWPEYEHRLALPTLLPAHSAPRWRGERAEGKTLLIQSEQGFGDLLQFLRYVPLARERSRAGRIILAVEPPLVRLLKQNGGDAEIVPHSDLKSPSIPPIDLQVALLSLPLALGIFEPLPMTSQYLRADPDLHRHSREQLGPASAIRVGLAWAGDPRHKQNHLRSLHFETLLPLLQLPGFQFYSLQLGWPSDRATSLAEAGVADLTRRINDFADTAAFVAELDLIITVDTAVAHLAGAMGRPVWALLSYQAEWRWGQAGEQTPWYPTMRLFRQRAPGDWDDVVGRVGTELGRFTSPSK